VPFGYRAIRAFGGHDSEFAPDRDALGFFALGWIERGSGAVHEGTFDMGHRPLNSTTGMTFTFGRRVEQIRWPDVRWVGIEPRWRLPMPAQNRHSRILSRAAEPNVVVGRLDSSHGVPEFDRFVLVPRSDHSAEEWITILRGAGVEVRD